MSRVQLTEDGKAAIHRFSSGDMRIAINLLQSASMSCNVVDEAGVYACTGYPNPSEMKRLLESCLNDSLTEAFKSIYHLSPIYSLSYTLNGLKFFEHARPIRSFYNT